MADSGLQRTSYALGTSSRQKHDSQIENLYQQFESLKSQIYGFDENAGLRSSQRKKQSLSRNRAAAHLQESTIKQCAFDFARQLEDIQKHGCHHSSAKKNSQVKEPLFRTEGKSRDQKGYEFNGLLSKNLDNYGTKIRQSGGEVSRSEKLISVEDLASDIERNEALFKELLSESSKIRVVEVGEQIDVEPIRDLFESFSQGFWSVLARVDSSVKFLNQKLRCLQMVFSEFAKIKRTMRQTDLRFKQKQKQLLLNVDSIENRYQQSIQELTLFYEEKIKDIQVRFQEESKKLKREVENSARTASESERNSLRNLLQKAKNVIGTKEELILSLQDENQQLRRQIERIGMDKSDGLHYSASGHKMKEEMAFISEIKVKPKLNGEHLEEEQEDDINLSELGSVKDGNLSEWDTSQLDLEHSMGSPSSPEGSYSEKEAK